MVLVPLHTSDEDPKLEGQPQPMLRVRESLNATISAKRVGSKASCVFGAYRIMCVWGKTAFSGIHELRESFYKHI